MHKKGVKESTIQSPISDSQDIEYLILKNLTKVFKNSIGTEIKAVYNISLTVKKGEFITLIGPSGCGKSTTLRMIAGFEKPTSGEILYEGRVITHLDPQDRHIPIVFQNYALFPHLNVFENIAYGLRARKYQPDMIEHDVAMICQMMNIVGIEFRFPHELSDGQQQRVALARALVLKPKVILFDEPLSNLDIRLRLQMRLEIKRMQQMLGITMIYVTHDQSEALSLPDRVVIMNRGEIAQIGSPEQVYNNPASLFIADFIGSANFIDATVEAINDTCVTLSMEDNIVLVPLACCNNPLKPGENVIVSINPEMIKLSSTSGQDSLGLIKGIVELSSFNGPTSEYKISFGSTLLRIIQPNVYGKTNRYYLGQEVFLSFEPSTFRVFRVEW